MNLELLAEFCARSEGGECATRTTKKEHAKSIKHMVDKHSRTENMPHIYTFAIIWKLARQFMFTHVAGFLTGASLRLEKRHRRHHLHRLVRVIRCTK